MRGLIVGKMFYFFCSSQRPLGAPRPSLILNAQEAFFRLIPGSSVSSFEHIASCEMSKAYFNFRPSLLHRFPISFKVIATATRTSFSSSVLPKRQPQTRPSYATPLLSFQYLSNCFEFKGGPRIFTGRAGILSPVRLIVPLPIPFRDNFLSVFKKKLALSFSPLLPHTVPPYGAASLFFPT